MTAPLEIDRGLLQFATDREKEYIAAIDLHGGASAAGRALNVNKATICRAIDRLEERAALQGYAPKHHMTRTVPDPFRVKRVSTYHKADEKGPGQWVIAEPDKAKVAETLRLYVEHLVGEARGAHVPTPAPERVMSDLLATYLFGDPHFGMKAIAEEAGENFDLAEADRLTRAGIDRLADATPDTEEALLIVIGDNTHANDGSHVTPAHQNPLDMDEGGHNRSMLVSAKAWAYACRRLLTKHKLVRLWFMPGNHDPDAAKALAMCLAMYFENEPRLIVDLSPTVFRYLRFGKVLIGAHHGDKVKQGDLPLLMAVDRPEDWGASVMRYVYMGHVHHDSVKEVQTVRVESIRTLAGKDAWHAGKGYRSLRDTRSIVHHKDYGEIERHTCSTAMLAA